MVINTCHVPETLIVNLHSNPEGNCYVWPHFADEETEQLSNLPESDSSCGIAELILFHW